MQNKSDIIRSGIDTICLEIDGLKALSQALEGELGDVFVQVALLISQFKGRVIISGMGKSGHVGRKVAATLASTGTAAYFVHPGEASHGDLGMITRDDVIIALSWSGEAPELANIITYARRFQIPLIAITSKLESTLGRQADYKLILPRMSEACPNGLAPTTSTIMQLALCDALAVSLLKIRGFSADDFRVFHPGGNLGAQLRYAKDIMHKGDLMPLIRQDQLMKDAIQEISRKNFGCVIVVNDEGELVGIVTDGDLRRNMSSELPSRFVYEVMSKNPKAVSPSTMLVELLEIQEKRRITSLIVIENNKPVGLIHYVDLLRAGAV